MSTAAVATLPRRLAIRIEHEFHLVLLLATYVLILGLLAPYQLYQDSWLTLASGREIVGHGLPQTDHLSVLAAGANWVDQQWLAQLTFYGATAVAGLRGAMLVHWILLTVAFGGALVAARWRGASSRAVFLVAAASIFVAPSSWQLRAQSFAYPLFVAVLWLLLRDVRTPSRRVLLVLPLLVVWANVHGSVLIGAGLVALRLAVLAVDRVRGTLRLDALSTAGLLAAPAAVLVSPYAFDLPGYYHRTIGNPLFATLVQEWQAPTLTRAAPFFLAAGAVTWLLGRHGRALRGFECAVLAVTIGSGFLAVRNVVWFSLAGVVLIPTLLDAAWPSLKREQRSSASHRFLTFTIAAATAVLPIIFTVALAGSRYESQWPAGARAAIARTNSEHPGTRVFATERFADWLLWHDRSLRGRIAYDTRFELLRRSQLLAIARYHGRAGDDWKRPARGFRLVVLDRTTDARLEPAFRSEPGIRTLYRDEQIVVFLRPRS
jgi:hypothetical protein